jgi:hypothetical protein
MDREWRSNASNNQQAIAGVRVELHDIDNSKVSKIKRLVRYPYVLDILDNVESQREGRWAGLLVN